MPGILAVGELADGGATRLTLELSAIAARLAAAAGSEASVLLVGSDAEAAAPSVAAQGASVLVAASPAPDAPAAAGIASLAAGLIRERQPEVVLIGATADGRDVAGILLALTDLPILANAAGIELAGADGPRVEASTFGGRMITSSIFRDGRGIILVRPGTVPSHDERGDDGAATPPGRGPGSIERIASTSSLAVPEVRVVERVTEPAAGPSIDDARVIIGAGRGVGGADGLAVVQELATALDGAVGATRAVVDSGWIDYAQQIGQTGKSVKPELYIACGISGAIQHKVGVQSAGTIVAINRDPDAPISEFADLVVIGDLFEVVPRLTEAIHEARAGGSGSDER